MGEYCSACDVGLCEFCGHACDCPHDGTISALFAAAASSVPMVA